MLYDMTFFTEQVAEKVRSRAAGRRMSQTELSLHTGIPLRTLGRRMAGTSPWTTDELAAVAKSLGCMPGDFLPDREKAEVAA